MHTYDVIYENLTYYRQSDANASSKFKKFSNLGRNEAHNYYLIY